MGIDIQHYPPALVHVGLSERLLRLVGRGARRTTAGAIVLKRRLNCKSSTAREPSA